MCARSCSCTCADLAGPLASLLVERLGSCQNGLIDWLVGRHHQQLWLIVILTISKLIFIIYLPLLYCLLILRLGQPVVGGVRRGWGIVGGGWKSRIDRRSKEKEEEGEKKGGGRRKPGTVGGKEAFSTL